MKGMLSDMEFEQRLTELSDNQPELLKFVARQTYTVQSLVGGQDKRITRLENQERQQLQRNGGIGGIAGFVGAVIVIVINYLVGKHG